MRNARGAVPVEEIAGQASEGASASPHPRAQGEATDSQRQFVLAALLLLALVAAVVLTGRGMSTSVDTAKSHPITASLGTATAMAALVVSWLCALRWRMVDDLLAFRLAVAVPLIFAGSTTVADFLRQAAGPLGEASGFGAARLALAATGVMVFGLAVRGGDSVSARLSPPWLLAVVGAMVVALYTAFSVAGIDRSPHFAHGLMATVAGMLGGVFMLSGVVVRRPIATWTGLMLVGVSLGELGYAAWPGLTWDVGAGLLGLTAAFLAIVGASYELKFAFAEQERRLMELQLLTALQREQTLEFALAHAARRHDQRSTVLAIESAFAQFGAAHEQLGPDDRIVLTDALRYELARLRRALESRTTDEAHGLYSLREHLQPLIMCARAKGVDVKLEMGSGIVVATHPDVVSEVVQNLVDNAFYHGGNRRVRVSAAEVDGGVEIVVEDDGPGIPEALRKVIFERGVTSKGDEHSGFGLYNSRELMREIGGDLVVESTARGGARFVASIPSPAHDSPEEASVDREAAAR